MKNESTTILLDDDELDRLIFNQYFQLSKNSHHDLKLFSNEEQLLSYIHLANTGQENFPKTIFLDINLPLKNGFQIFDEIKNLCTPNNMPRIILYSHSDHRLDKEKAKSLNIEIIEKFSNSKKAVEFLNNL